MLDHEKINQLDSDLRDAVDSAVTKEGFKYLDKALSYLRLAVQWEQSPEAALRGRALDDLHQITYQPPQGEQ